MWEAMKDLYEWKMCIVVGNKERSSERETDRLHFKHVLIEMERLEKAENEGKL